MVGLGEKLLGFRIHAQRPERTRIRQTEIWPRFLRYYRHHLVSVSFIELIASTYT